MTARIRVAAVAATIIAATAAGVLGVSPIVGPARAVADPAPLSCLTFDSRTASDAAPRQGVVVPQSLPGATTYDTFALDAAGNRYDATVSDGDYLIPLVGMWQAGTDCYGHADSRNVWGVGPTGRVWGEDRTAGPAASWYGDASTIALNRPIVGMSPTADGLGYWLVASDGGIFSFGDAAFHGSTGAIRLNRPIVGMTSTAKGLGYWMVASDGGIFSFGDAQFYGSTGAIRLNRPIVGMAATSDGRGYWMVASDGGVFTFGDAQFRGSMGGSHISAPIVGMIPFGNGYTLIGADDTLYSFHL